MTTLTDTNGAVFTYTFDAEGNRRSQSLNDCLETRFLYDGPDVLLELDPSNAVTYAWIDGPGIDQPIERIMYLNGAPRARRVFHADALGSIAALTAPDGHVTQTYAYSAFGTLRSSSGPDLNRVTYTARDLLGDSQGWMYYRFRAYDPRSGRFVPKDPLGFVSGANVWQYVGNQPVRYTDAFGLWCGADDVLTGPVDEIIVIGSLFILASFGNEWAQDLLDSIQNLVLCSSDNDAVDGAGNAYPSDTLIPTGERKEESSTRKGNRNGGKSVQEGYKDPQGRDVTKHTIYGPKGNIVEKPHYRPGGFK